MIGFFAVILLFGISPAWGAKPAVKLYVDASASAGGDGTSWADAFTDLQDALDAAVFGDEIWVAAGTYKPTDTSDRSVSFVLKSGVALYGGFAGGEKFLLERSLDPSLTVLSGDIGTKGDDTDNSFHVVYADGVTGAVLDGFTVTLGRGDDVSVGPWATFAGAGMYNTNSALTVSNCIFSHNKVAVRTNWTNGNGAGMYNYNSAPVVTNCTFSGNQAGNTANNATGRGGGMYNEGYFDDGLNDQFPVITGCTFSDNVASSKYEIIQGLLGGGGGIYNAGVSATIDRCIFIRNLAGWGGGMFNYGGMMTITNCIFDTNSNSYSEGRGGAIFNYACWATILNCTFYQNGWRLFTSGTEPLFRPYTQYGGAVYNHRGGSTIFNCIFSNNAVRARGGAVVSDSHSQMQMGTKLINCLFYKNFSWQGSDPGNEVISHLIGKFHPDSANNFYDIDPLLVDPAAGDFHLSYDSPCIDAGYALTFGYLAYPDPRGLPDTDFEGDKRIVDSDGDGVPAIDIGVDEFIPNLPDLRAFLQALADAGEIDPAEADRLLAYVDDAQAALDLEEGKTAIRILNKLIADAWASLDDTENAQVIEMKTQAVIEVI